MKFIKDLRRKGQGMLEYMIISGLIGIFCLSAVKMYGKSIKTRIDQMKSKVTKEIQLN